MSQLDTLLDQQDAPGWRMVAYAIMSLLGLFILWAGFARLDEVAIAAGEVVPQGRVKTVQHLEGGIIDEIFVREGDTVREGTPLVLIGPGRHGHQYGRASSQVGWPDHP